MWRKQCPLLRHSLKCHAFDEGRCNQEPTTCNLAMGFRRYSERQIRERTKNQGGEVTMDEVQRWLNEVAWKDFIYWAFGSEEMRGAFERQTKTPPMGRSPIEVMVDQGTGFEQEYLRKFVLWATEFHWGMDYAPESVREELENKK